MMDPIHHMMYPVHHMMDPPIHHMMDGVHHMMDGVHHMMDLYYIIYWTTHTYCYYLLLFTYFINLLGINKGKVLSIRRRISRLPLTRKFWFDLNPSLQTLGKYLVKHRLVKIFRTWVFQKLKMKVWNWLYTHSSYQFKVFFC